MNVLIVGLGYAGTRFYNALNYVAIKHGLSLSIAYVDKCRKKHEIQYFENMEKALSLFKPQLIVVTVNDEVHAEILNQLQNYDGFIICEKPLANRKDDLNKLANNLKTSTGFCFDLIERYSEATIALKDYISTHKLNLIRAHFHWGKDRINDYRPTCGVASEVIHALDLIQHLTSSAEHYQINQAMSTCSDFSISGTRILDSIMLSGYLGDAVITGYSSFVNIVRKREIDLTLVTSEHKLIFAHMIFDTPEWDIDYLRVWERTANGERQLIEIHTNKTDANKSLQTIKKLSDLVEDVILFILTARQPKLAFPNLIEALYLQKLLNSIEQLSEPLGPVKYVRADEREFFVQEGDLERLG